MVMTSEEIVRDYLQARNKSKQIKILADLNLTTQAEIKRVLAEEGAEAHKRPRKRPLVQAGKKDTPEKPEALETESYGQTEGASAKPQGNAPPGADSPEVYRKIENILAALPADMGSKARWAAGKLAAELFAEYLMVRLGLEKADGRCETDAEV